MTASQQIDGLEAVRTSKAFEIRGIQRPSGQRGWYAGGGDGLGCVRHFDTGLGQFSASDRLDMTCRYFALDLRRAAMVQL